MKFKSAAPLVAATLGLSMGGASAQGLLSIDSVTDYWEDIPFNVTANVQLGWDSNSNSSSDDAQSSSYMSANVTAAYGFEGERSNASIGADVGVSHYFDGGPGLQDTNYNARAFVNYSRKLTSRMTFSNNLYITYEVEPDYEIGVSTSRSDDQYIYFYERAALTYAWTERFSTVASYGFSGIAYESGDLSDAEDRYIHNFGLQGRYRLSPRTTAIAEYRLGWTDYQRLDADSTSHYFLVGLDHSFSPRLTGSVRGGVQYFDSNRTSTIAPYLETSLSYLVSRRTSVRGYGRLGFEGSELGSFESRYGFRTGITASHQFTERLSGNAGLHYAYSLFAVGDEVPSEVQDFIDEVEDAREEALDAAEAAGVELTDEQLAVFDIDDIVPTDDRSEHQISLNLGVGYRLFANVDVNAGYTYTTVSSDTDERGFDRHRAYLGLGARF